MEEVPSPIWVSEWSPSYDHEKVCGICLIPKDGHIWLPVASADLFVFELDKLGLFGVRTLDMRKLEPRQRQVQALALYRDFEVEQTLLRAAAERNVLRYAFASIEETLSMEHKWAAWGFNHIGREIARCVVCGIEIELNKVHIDDEGVPPCVGP